jgi:hypothetical protein
LATITKKYNALEKSLEL